MKPMLAKDAPAELAGVSFPLIVQTKLDGIRCVISGGRALTRTLKEVPNREIFTALSHSELEGLDGELIVGDPAAPDAYRTTTSFVMAGDKTGASWAFYVFDKWDEDRPFLMRYHAAFDVLRANSTAPAQMVQNTAVQDVAELEAAEAAALAAGHEGLILRDPAGHYKFGRSGVRGPLLKLKRYIDFEATIVGFYEEMHNANERVVNELGRGQRSSHGANKHGKGTLGGFVLEAINGPAAGVEFRCGTGFSAAHRAEFWQEQNALLRRIVKVKSFPIGAKDKPRHPVWLGFRDMEVDG